MIVTGSGNAGRGVGNLVAVDLADEFCTFDALPGSVKSVVRELPFDIRVGNFPAMVEKFGADRFAAALRHIGRDQWCAFIAEEFSPEAVRLTLREDQKP